MTALRVLVVMDYQNIHLTGHQRWAPVGVPVHDSLVRPAAFAEQLMTARAARSHDPAQKSAELAGVEVFRGLPSNQRQPRAYAANLAQKAEWERDPRVRVTYRPLRYPNDWPSMPAQEKGIDVLVALELVLQARDARFDVVILAAHDTDQEPALESALRRGKAKIETAGWQGCRRLRVPGFGIWHTALGEAEFQQSLDRRDYSSFFST